MDITKCIPSIKISGLSLTDPPEEQVTLVSGSFSSKGAIGQVHFYYFLVFLLFFFKKKVFRPKCKIFPFNIFYVVPFRGMTLPPSVFKLSTVGQTESSPSSGSKGCSFWFLFKICKVKHTLKFLYTLIG